MPMIASDALPETFHRFLLRQIHTLIVTCASMPVCLLQSVLLSIVTFESRTPRRARRGAFATNLAHRTVVMKVLVGRCCVRRVYQGKQLRPINKGKFHDFCESSCRIEWISLRKVQNTGEKSASAVDLL